MIINTNSVVIWHRLVSNRKKSDQNQTKPKIGLNSLQNKTKTSSFFGGSDVYWSFIAFNVGPSLSMARIIRRPLNLTAAVRFRLSPLSPFSGNSGSINSETTSWSELIRVPSLVEGCDYKHWLVLMKPPNGYPTRNHIVQSFVETLAMALGR